MGQHVRQRRRDCELVLHHLRPAPKRKRSFFFGAEQALGSLLVLLVAYVLGIYMTGSHDGVISELTGTAGGDGLNSLMFWIVTGLFWLAGGVSALIFWPILITHLLVRGVRKLLA